jgi:hypothetical protein
MTKAGPYRGPSGSRGDRGTSRRRALMPALSISSTVRSALLRSPGRLSPDARKRLAHGMG